MRERDDRGRYTSNRRINDAIRSAVFGTDPVAEAPPAEEPRTPSWDGGARKSPPPAGPSMNELLRERLLGW